MELRIEKYDKHMKELFLEFAQTPDPIDKKFIEGALHVIFKSKNARNHTYAAFIGNEMVGYIMGMCVDNTILFPHAMFVSPQHRRKGIASRLIEKLESDNAWEVSLIYYEKSHDKYYKKLGYAQGMREEDVMYAAIKVHEGDKLN